MNDDFPSASPFRSAIADPALWTGTGEIIVDGPIALPAGDYILAITGFSNNIENAANEDLFRIDSLFDFDALYGPDQGILGPAHHWESPAGDTSGSYTIALGGATYSVPAPGALVVLGVTWVIRRRR
jgi:hypothetical protein